MKKEEGSILVSVCLFVSFTAFILVGITSMIRYQSIQLRQLQYNYVAKSMLEMSETIVRDKEEAVEGFIQFSDGKVLIEQIDETEFLFTASLDRGYTLRKPVEIRGFIDLGKESELEEEYDLNEMAIESETENSTSADDREKNLKVEDTEEYSENDSERDSEEVDNISTDKQDEAIFESEDLMDIKINDKNSKIEMKSKESSQEVDNQSEN